MSLQKIIEIPEQNPLRFYDEAAPYPGMQTLRPDASFKDQIKFWDVKTNYLQKYETNDWITFQCFVGGAYIENNGIFNHRIFIHDADDNVVGTIFPNTIDSVVGNSYTVNGVEYTLFTLTFGFSFAQLGLFDGYYTLRLALFSVFNALPFYDYYRSEPIYARETHPRTVAIGYTSFTNKANNIDYKQGAVAFTLRIEGKILWTDITSDAAGYQDQNLNVRQQTNITGKVATLFIGQKGNCPMWILSKVNEAFANDYVLVDRDRYEKPIKNKIEVNFQNNGFQKYKAKLELVPYDKDALNITLKKNPLIVFEIPVSETYLVYTLAIKNAASGNTVDVFTGYEINNAQQTTDFLSAINNYWVKVKGLTGYFARIGNLLTYVNGEGENYDTNASVFLMNYIIFRHERSSQYTTPQIRFNLTVRGKRWAVAPLHNYEVFCYGNPTTLTTASNNYNFVANGNPANTDIKLWHDTHITEIYITDSYSLTFIIEGVWPIDIVKISIDKTSLDRFGLGAINTTLQYLQVTNSLVTDVLSLNVKNWAALTHILLNNNKINTTTVDKLFNDHQASTPVIPTALFFGLYAFIINNQNPAATATGASAAARAVLTGKKWQVLF